MRRKRVIRHGKSQELAAPPQHSAEPVRSRTNLPSSAIPPAKPGTCAAIRPVVRGVPLHGPGAIAEIEPRADQRRARGRRQPLVARRSAGQSSREDRSTRIGPDFWYRNV